MEEIRKKKEICEGRNNTKGHIKYGNLVLQKLSRIYMNMKEI